MSLGMKFLHKSLGPNVVNPNGKSSFQLMMDFRIRGMLGNPKCHCKHKCLLQFTGTASFQELEKFRKDWAGLHKLDQDTVEPRCRFLVNIL